MGYQEFSPFNTESIEVRFTCFNCKEEVHSDSIDVPSPNIFAEKARDSYNEREDGTVCPSCHTEYEITVHSGFSDAYVEVEGIDDEDIIEVIENENVLDAYYEEQIEAILSSKDYYGIFMGEMDMLIALNEIEITNTKLQNTLYRQNYSSIITCLEDYLSSTLTEKVLGNDEYYKNFIRSYKPFRDLKFSVSEILDKLDQLKSMVKKELIDIIYHNLGKVKPIYEATFKIKFPEISDIASVIQKRHDIVHRNGKDKSGVKISITMEEVNSTIQEVVHFVMHIDSLVNPDDLDELLAKK